MTRKPGLAMWWMIALAVGTVAAQETAKVFTSQAFEGRICDHFGWPVRAARVEVIDELTAAIGPVTFTDAEGLFLVPVVGASKLHVRVSKTGHASIERDLRRGEPGAWILQAAAPTVAGRVVDTTGNGIVGAKVVCISSGARRASSVVVESGFDGRFSLVGLDLGAYMVGAFAVHREWQLLREVWPIAGDITIPMGVAPTSKLIVEAPSSAAVQVRFESELPLPPLLRGVDGRWVAEGIGPKFFSVVAVATEDWFPAASPVIAIPGQTVQVALEPLPASGHRLTARIRNRGGRPLPGRSIWVGDTPRGQVLISDDSGEITFVSRAPAGQVISLRCAEDGWAPFDAASDWSVDEWLLSGNEAEGAVFIAAPTVAIPGRVRTADGSPVAGCEVAAFKFHGSDVVARTVTRTDGRFSLSVVFDAGRRIRVCIDDASAEPKEQLVVLEQGPMAEATFEVAKPGIVIGRMTNARGAPVAGLELRVKSHRAGNRGLRVLVTDTDGGFGLRGVPSGRWSIGWDRKNHDFEVVSGESVRLDLVQ